MPQLRKGLESFEADVPLVRGSWRTAGGGGATHGVILRRTDATLDAMNSRFRRLRGNAPLPLGGVVFRVHGHSATASDRGRVALTDLRLGNEVDAGPAEVVLPPRRALSTSSDNTREKPRPFSCSYSRR